MQGAAIYIALLIGMNFLWAGANTVVKATLGSMDPLTLVFWRLLIAFLVLAAWVAAKGYPLKIRLRDATRIIGTGAIVGASQLLWVTGIGMSHATDASLLYVFEPILGIVLAKIILRERMHSTTVIGLAIVMGGFAALADFDTRAFGWEGGGVPMGNMLVVASLLLECLSSIVVKPVVRNVPPQVVCTLTVGVALAFVSLPVALRGGIIIPSGKGEVMAIAYLALICTAVGYSIWMSAMKRVPLGIIFFTIFIQPIAGPFIAAALIGEAIDARVLIGGALLLFGMLVAIAGYLRGARWADVHAVDEAIPVVGGV